MRGIRREVFIVGYGRRKYLFVGFGVVYYDAGYYLSRRRDAEVCINKLVHCFVFTFLPLRLSFHDFVRDAIFILVFHKITN